PIRGIFLTLRGSDVLGKILDEFHGYSAMQPEQSLFIKTPVEVQVDGVSNTMLTLTYSMNPAKLPRTAILINDGDWQRSMTERAPLTQNLTPNQKTYIQKLGRSTGRDIVPINLDLYRELMNKGLIVDKGRRLALTALGQEVYRYLE
ncbi:MAG TPA: gamma-glutamylcyclotransferase, partial [Bdellovibrionales bacterium]|nr:gamma-glutamylcyclotransferase [Bdellovibrionales bacterium]